MYRKIGVATLLTLFSALVNSATVTLTSGGDFEVSYDDQQGSLVEGKYTIQSATDFNDGTGQILLGADFGVAGDPGNGQQQAEGEVTFTITGINGFGISSVFVLEGGFYTVTGNGSVAQTGSLSVTNNNGGYTNNAGYSPVNLTTGQPDPLSAVGVETGWTATGSAAVQSSVFTPPFGVQIQNVTSDSVTVTINNILFATAPTNLDSAQIEKNNSSSFVVLGVNAPPPAPVPVPAAIWFMMSALISLRLFKRKVV